MDGNIEKSKAERKANEDVSIILKLDKEHAALLEAAIERGDFKQFGITKAERVSPEEMAAIPEDRWQRMEGARRVQAKDDSTPPIAT